MEIFFRSYSRKLDPSEAHGLIYVVDLSNEEIMKESYQTLIQVIKHSYIQGKSMLVLANKTDLCEYPDILDFYERFPLESLANLYQTHILLQCCGHNDYTELFSGIDWLRFRIEFEYEQLRNRIKVDIHLEKTRKEPPSEIRRLGTIDQVRSYFGRPRSAPCVTTSTSKIRAKSAEGRFARPRHMLRTNRVHIADDSSLELPPRSNDNKNDVIELKPVFKVNEK